MRTPPAPTRAPPLLYVRACRSQYDADKNGKMCNKEFIAFCTAMVEKENVSREIPEDLSTIITLIGPSEAAQGFARARAVLAANPAVATVAGPGGYLPIHIVLMADPPATTANGKAASAAVVSAASVTLVNELLKAAPGCAKERVMKGYSFPDGHLPLHLALMRNHPLAMVQSVIAAWPEAVEVLDAKQEEKKPPKKIVLKKKRVMRGVAEEGGCPPEVLALLPAPKMKKKEVVWEMVTDAPEEPKDAKGKKGKK